MMIMIMMGQVRDGSFDGFKLLFFWRGEGVDDKACMISPSVLVSTQVIY
jgi:hypothetical protein